MTPNELEARVAELEKENAELKKLIKKFADNAYDVLDSIVDIIYHKYIRENLPDYWEEVENEGETDEEEETTD